MRWRASSSLGGASTTDMRNIKSIQRYLRGNPGIMTVRPRTLNLEAVKTAPVGSVLTYDDLDWAGDADRFSGAASWIRDKLGWYPIKASSRKQSTIALGNGEAELVAALSERVRAWVCDNSETGYESSETHTIRRLKRHNRSCAVIPLRRLV